ncbi:MAG: peptidoglycan editing factor PgeF [Candidatus Margulisiibacteriota bacterium]
MITWGSRIFSASNPEKLDFQCLRYVVSTASDGNIGLHTELSVQDAIRNRQILLQRYGLKLEHLVAMEQVHGANIVRVDERDMGKGSTSMIDAIAKTDALITSSKNIILLAQGADCPLCWVFDPAHEAIGVAHSGWRGTIRGIIPRMIEQMSQEYGTNPSSVWAQVSPCAGSCCYEVGDDVAENFRDTRFLEASRKGVRSLNIKKAIEQQLLDAGVPWEQTEMSEICTICDERYFSYRRDQTQAGRFGLFAWLRSESLV